jgi:hypothetical protein
MAIQLNLFKPHIIKKAHLSAPSPRKAFYRMRLESHLGRYMILKESGIGERVMDQRRWVFGSLEEAEKSYTRRVMQKTDPNRRSPRKYKPIESLW